MYHGSFTECAWGWEVEDEGAHGIQKSGAIRKYRSIASLNRFLYCTGVTIVGPVLALPIIKEAPPV